MIDCEPTTNAWTHAGKLPEGNQGESAAYVDGQLIVAQGSVDYLGRWQQNQLWSTTAITLRAGRR